MEELFQVERWDIPPDLRERAINVASEWAVDHCYLPCPYTMCGTVGEYSGDSLLVYVSYDYIEEPDLIGPEAYVKIALPGFEIVDEYVFHSGCRARSDDCDQ